MISQRNIYFWMFVIGLLLPSVKAPVSCISASGNVDGFKACAFKAFGSGGASDSRTACSGNSGDAYNACMCAAASGVVKCDHCAGDAGLRNQIQDQANYCNVKATTTQLTTMASIAALETLSVSQTISLSTSAASSMATIPSMFSYPSSSIVAGVDLNGLPPFPNSKGLKDDICGAIGVSLFLILLMCFA